MPVLGGVVLLYVHWGLLDELLWTAFVYPPKALATSPPTMKPIATRIPKPWSGSTEPPRGI